jgi:hypothetical protein
MHPADLRPGDTVLARHSKPRPNSRPLITESHAVVEKVYAKDNLIVARVTRRFAYVEGSPTLGQAIPLVQQEEAFDFEDLVSVLAVAGAKPAPEPPRGDAQTMEVTFTVKYQPGADAEAARAALERSAQQVRDVFLQSPGISPAAVEECTFEINEVPADPAPAERQRG